MASIVLFILESCFHIYICVLELFAVYYFIIVNMYVLQYLRKNKGSYNKKTTIVDEDEKRRIENEPKENNEQLTECCSNFCRLYKNL